LAKVTAPLLSFGASGQVAKTQVYSSWRGRPYVRRHVTPAYSRTDSQDLTRNAFSFLQQVYKFAPAGLTAPWDSYIKGLVMTSRNAFTKFNLPVLREETDLDNWVASPGSLGGIPPKSAVSTDGSGQLSIAITAPDTIPTGWTIAKAVACCLKDQDPQSGTDYEVTAGEDATSTYAVVLTGLDAVLYQFRAWLVWNRPDGQLAYSPSIGGTDTPS